MSDDSALVPTWSHLLPSDSLPSPLFVLPAGKTLLRALDSNVPTGHALLGGEISTNNLHLVVTQRLYQLVSIQCFPPKIPITILYTALSASSWARQDFCISRNNIYFYISWSVLVSFLPSPVKLQFCNYSIKPQSQYCRRKIWSIWWRVVGPIN